MTSRSACHPPRGGTPSGPAADTRHSTVKSITRPRPRLDRHRYTHNNPPRCVQQTSIPVQSNMLPSLLCGWTFKLLVRFNVLQLNYPMLFPILHVILCLYIFIFIHHKVTIILDIYPSTPENLSSWSVTGEITPCCILYSTA